MRDRALDKAFRLHGAYAPKDPKEAAQFGVKVVIIDVPRPQYDVFMPDIGPGQLLGASGSNGHKRPAKSKTHTYGAKRGWRCTLCGGVVA
jgi:hypothetical protein